ncbi:hypothetical protein HF670_03990 [Acidithiobacillus thiooxidans]|uniref:toprim domain-containing protein n=1 Tax=Acidithiobacillus thiooxidans TaxID=930 RepID=UPI001C070D99|nr:toprim domain-containing protein [Acidithiobacillus thiooxidans]MBU2838736.1 hypothetical protein [Acidithiobacillus thiooxidans]
MSIVALKSTPKSFNDVATEIEPLVQKFRRSGNSKATFLCPNHDDKNASAWIAQTESGWTHAHCSVCGNLREHFNQQGVFFSQSGSRGKRRSAPDRSGAYYDRLKSKTPENKNYKQRQLEVLYYGEPEGTLTHDVYPLDSGLSRGINPQHAMFAENLWRYTPEAVEQAHKLTLHYLQSERKLEGPFHDLLFSANTLDNHLGQDKRALFDSRVKAVLITPLKNPAHFHERAWQETWLDAKGRKIARHFPAGIPQSGHVFYRKQAAAKTLIIGEGLESTLSVPDHFGKTDRIAVMSLANFPRLELIKRYENVLFVPDLEVHGKGLKAVLNLAAQWLSTSPARLYLMRPDGKPLLDPITDKLDANDLTREQLQALRPVFLDADNLLPKDHPMRHWSKESTDKIYNDLKKQLKHDLNQPGSGKKNLIAVGTGVGKSHALGEILPRLDKTAIACTTTREGRCNLARNLTPEQEHHGRAEPLAGCEPLANDSEKPASPEQIVENPQTWCKMYFHRFENATYIGRGHITIDADTVPAPAIISPLGFPIAPVCNHECPHGLTTLHHLTDGQKGANTGADLCPHLLKRLEHWYQEDHLVSTHAGLNGDPLLLKSANHLRDQVIIDEAPALTDKFTWVRETLDHLRHGVFCNHQTDQRFYSGADREERLNAYHQITAWVVHIQNCLQTGWENGDIPPLSGHGDWQEFYDLVKKHKHFGFVTIFERMYRDATERKKPGEPLKKHYGPVLLDRLSQAIQQHTLFYQPSEGASGAMTSVLHTEIGQRLKTATRKQDMMIMTATPSRALKTLCPNIIEKYPATPNLHINWTRGRAFSATALARNPEETIRDAVDILEALPEKGAALMTKAHEEAIGTETFPNLMIGHWNRDHEGQNRWKAAKHLEIIGLQYKSCFDLWMEYEALRRLYNLPWQPAKQNDPWENQNVGISYLPGSENTVYLPKDNPDFAFFVREQYTIEVAQAVGRLRASRRLDETLTVNLRTNIPLLPLFGLVVNSFDGHAHKQLIIHERAVDHVAELVKAALDAGLKPTFRQIDQLAKTQSGKGIRYTNWKKVVDYYVNGDKSLTVNAVQADPDTFIDIEQLWLLKSQPFIDAEARRRGDRIRRREAALPGRGDGPEGQALLNVMAIMDREHCDSAKAALKLLQSGSQNRHHPGDEYEKALERIIAHPIPDYYWLDEDNTHVG